MNLQEANKWAKKQTVVKVSAIKENEEDKFVFTVGQYVVTPHVFNTQEEAEEYLRENFKLNNMDLAIIGAITQRLNELNEQTNQKNNEL